MKKLVNIIAMLGVVALVACTSDNRSAQEEQRMEDVNTEQSVDSQMQEEEAVIEEYEDSPAMDDAGEIDTPEAQEDVEEYSDPYGEEEPMQDDSLGY